MKHVRTFLSLLVVGLMLTGTAWAQGDLSLGGGGDAGGLATGITDATFSGSASMTVRLLHPYHHADSVVEGSYVDTVKTVSARTDGAKVLKFTIENLTASQDTLRTVTVRSFNDKPNSFENIYLYRDADSTGAGTKIGEVLDLGSSTTFSENEALAFSINDTIPAGDTVYYWFTADMDSARIDTLFNDQFCGLKIFQNGLFLATNGYAPTGATDTLRYAATDAAFPEPHCDETGVGGPNGDGRVLIFDTKPPEMTIELTHALDTAGCGANSIINLGDSIFITVWDTVEVFEITKAWANLCVFGGSATAAFGDTLDVGADSAVTWGLMMPDTDSSITCPLDVAPWFYWLVVTTEDEPGNQKIDSLLVSYAIDNQQPVFDGDSVWMELVYDANGDGTAAVDDIVQVFAYFTSNSFGEIDAVTVDMSNWGYGATEPMTDPSGNRKWFSASFDVLTGSEDWAADSSASLFTVTALDNACNWDTVSNVAHFAVDNEGPFAPLQFLYESLMDLDSNAIINVGDSVIFTIDATNTSDLAAICEVVLDLYAPGLGGDPSQCVEDTDLAGQHVLRYGIVAGTANAATGVHTVDVTLTDDAGNSADFTSSVLQRPIDNEPPLPVADLDATRSPCAIDLSWTSSNADDARYFIFWDGGDGWTAADTTRDADGNLVFLDTLGSVIPPALSWTTDGTVVLTHGATYEFVVRTADDADNYEWNFARVATTADCEPPTVCINYPASGGAYGLTNPITVVAESPDADIAVATLYIRDSDAGGGVPSAWMSLGVMTQVGGGQQFTKTVTDANILGLFTNTGDQTYEFLTVGTDGVGNSQTLSEANAACDDFSFLWFHTALQTALMTVNDTILPQTSCGYNVTRDDNNAVVLNVNGHVDGRTYTFDIFHLVSGDADYRIHYEENVGVLPYSFALDATDWLKGTNEVYVVVTRDDGNVGQESFDACVPDDDAPDATILYPIDGQRVRRMNSVLNPLQVWARVADWTYDPAPISRVDFAQATSYDMTENYSVFGVQTTPAWGDTFSTSWDTRAFSDGDTVYLQATFYDDKNNTQTTPVVTVYMDGQATDIILTCPQAGSINGVPAIAGTVDFFAEIQESYNDFTNLILYYKKSTDPDIFSYWTSAGAMAPGTDEGVYVTYGFNTTGLASDMNWDWRVIATDITGHVMFDYDGDGVFDDNTFDPATWNSDNFWRVDNTAADFAFKEILAGGITFPTPSTKLNGAGMIFVPARQPITAWSQTIPMSDTSEVTRVNYFWVDDSDSTSVAQVGPQPWYEATFNPYDLGLYTDADIMNTGYSGKLVVFKEDGLNRTPVSDVLNVTVLDVDPNQALVAGVTWGQYVWGDVGLTALSLNAYNIRWVIYEFQPDGGTGWTVIDSSSAGGSFGITWHTLGNAPDGWGWVRATAVDNDFNRDPNPTPMKIYVANALPTVTQTAPTPDSSFIGEGSDGSGTIFTATADNGDIPIDSVQFMRKGVLSGSWSRWATDLWPPYQAEWDDSYASDGAYHFMVRAWNRAGRFTDSPRWTFYHDESNPSISQTMIAGQDVEANNDPALDLTGLDEISIEGAFFDNGSSTGANSGIVMVGFELQDQSGSRVFAKFIDPATDGLHSVMFNISGLPTGQYGFYYRAWDAVGNMTFYGPVNGWVSDQTPPTTSVIGHYGNRLYGYDWSGDATRALFEYYNGTEWVGIGAAAPLSIDYSWNDGEIDNFWWTELDPTSIPAGTHPFHMMATDASGNWSATNALEIDVTSDGAGILAFTAGTDLSDLAVIKNYETCNFEGVLSVEATSANTPIVLGVYETGEFGTDDYSYESVMLRPYLQGTLFQEDVHPYDIFCGGKAVFLVGAADGEGALNTDISSYRYRDDFGTNGMVLGNDDNVEVTIPAGDHDGCLMVLETLLPRSGPFQDRWEPIGNHNPGMANYIGENDCNCFNDNRFATIKMSYDPTVILPAESLMVAWWDESDGEWEPTGVYYLTGDEGFNTVAHTVEFSTNCLHGVFAVLALREPSQPGTISFEFVEANPYCNGYVGPHHYYSQPKFVWRVVDWYSKIDPDMFEVKLDGHYIHRFGVDSDFWTTDWDSISQELRIYPYSGDYESSADFASDLECGDHTLYIAAKNNQANFASMTWEFTVDCTPPTVVFDNYYTSKNPTISFTVTDDLAGVDWGHVFVDVVAFESNDVDLQNPNQDENLFFLGTFFPGQVEYYADAATGEVTITTTYDLEHKRGIMVAIYDGTRSYYDDDYWAAGDPVTLGDWSEFYLHGHGVMDCVGNSGDPWFQVLTIDNTPGEVVDNGEGFTWPNPFDPSVDGVTTIESNFTSGGGVMITIYDFAGYEVKTLNADASGVATWNGRSSDGEIVANGVYFAYCMARDGSHKVVKIAVIKD